MSSALAGLWIFNLIACVAIGALAWTGGRCVHALLRISDASRGYWTAVWAVAVVPPSVAIALQWLLPAQGPTALPIALPLGDAVSTVSAWSNVLTDTKAASDGSGPTAVGQQLLVLAYLLGVGCNTYRWLRGVDSVRRIVRDSSELDLLQLGPLSGRVVCELTRFGIAVRSTDAPVSPFAVSWPQPTILLPSAVAAHLSDTQLRTVLRHEAAHLAARDPQRTALIRAVGVVFWFNPFLRCIARRIQLAAELRCDAEAVAGETGARRACAEAYVATLRLAARAPVAGSAAFSDTNTDTHKLRIHHMLRGDPRGMPRLATLALLGSAAMTTGTVLAATQFNALSADFGSNLLNRGVPVPTGNAASRVLHPVSSGKTSSTGSIPISMPTFRFPIENPEITGLFGDVGGPRTRPHRGVDFRGPPGKTVRAPAAGVVVAATTLYQDSPQYGTVVVLDHGGGWQTLYAHLAQFSVSVGDRVSTGEPIGQVGATGKVTGPHLHMEMLLNGKRIDPRPLLQ